MKGFNHKYKRLIKILFTGTMVLGLVSIYGYVWICYYNKYIIQIGFYKRGNWVIIFLYCLWGI